MLKNGSPQVTKRGVLPTGSFPLEESDDESLDDLDLPSDYSNLPVQVNWNSQLPANICVPRVPIHSLILDFAAVSFLDMSATKGLKAVMDILDKLHNCKFFDDEVRTSMFFPTLHDAMMYVQMKHPQDTLFEKSQLRELHMPAEVSVTHL